MHPIDQSRLARVKPSFVTRRVDRGDIGWLDEAAGDLASGDLVIARVEEIGQHTRIERPDGRRAHLFPGDEIMLACGARYAPDQFEADCPAAIGPANLAAAGGIAGLVQLCHGTMKPATTITLLGALHNRDGLRMNVGHYGVTVAPRALSVPLLAVCGTSMNAGKTHSVAALVRGFAAAGCRVAAIKATGTGAGGDLWLFRDSGAHHVRDFTDAGFASTYRVPVAGIFAGLCRLASEAEAAGAEVIVVELADGLYQSETAELVQLEGFRSMLSGLVFAAGDAMGAEAGVGWLQRAGLPVLAVSGRLTRSPLALRETAAAIGLPCYTAEQLETAEVALGLGPVPLAEAVRTAA